MGSPFAHHWTLDPAVDFLNHGSYGATPRPVLEAQQQWRERMEREPVRFLSHDLEPALDAARDALARFVGADSADIGFVPNVTAATNAVLRSLSFHPGDELLTTDHAYNALKNTLEYVAERSGARAVIARVPFPLESEDDVVAGVLAAVTPRTRLAILDHVTSATAIVFPVRRLIGELAERGIDTLVDGAHAPGQIPLSVAGIGAAYYAGNLHKWVCAPKGAGFLWVQPDRQVAIRPVSISHGANSPRQDKSRFQLEFDWTGTADPTPYLAVPDALAFGAQLLPGGWDALRERNRALVLEARALLLAALGTPPSVPDGMIGCMASVPHPAWQPAGEVQGVDLYADELHARLIDEGFEAMVTPWPQRPDGGPWRRLIRVSAAAYNDIEQFRRLADAVGATLPT